MITIMRIDFIICYTDIDLLPAININWGEPEIQTGEHFDIDISFLCFMISIGF